MGNIQNTLPTLMPLQVKKMKLVKGNIRNTLPTLMPLRVKKMKLVKVLHLQLVHFSSRCRKDDRGRRALSIRGDVKGFAAMDIAICSI